MLGSLLRVAAGAWVVAAAGEDVAGGVKALPRALSKAKPMMCAPAEDSAEAAAAKALKQKMFDEAASRDPDLVEAKAKMAACKCARQACKDAGTAMADCTEAKEQCKMKNPKCRKMGKGKAQARGALGAAKGKRDQMQSQCMSAADRAAAKAKMDERKAARDADKAAYDALDDDAKAAFCAEKQAEMAQKREEMQQKRQEAMDAAKARRDAWASMTDEEKQAAIEERKAAAEAKAGEAEGKPACKGKGRPTTRGFGKRPGGKAYGRRGPKGGAAGDSTSTSIATLRVLEEEEALNPGCQGRRKAVGATLKVRFTDLCNSVEALAADADLEAKCTACAADDVTGEGCTFATLREALAAATAGAEGDASDAAEITDMSIAAPTCPAADAGRLLLQARSTASAAARALSGDSDNATLGNDEMEVTVSMMVPVETAEEASVTRQELEDDLADGTFAAQLQAVAEDTGVLEITGADADGEPYEIDLEEVSSEIANLLAGNSAAAPRGFVASLAMLLALTGVAFVW